MQAVGGFDAFVAWGHDEVPTADTNDAMRMMAWLEIAEDVSVFG